MCGGRWACLCAPLSLAHHARVSFSGWAGRLPRRLAAGRAVADAPHDVSDILHQQMAPHRVSHSMPLLSVACLARVGMMRAVQRPDERHGPCTHASAAGRADWVLRSSGQQEMQHGA
mgnify:CR=1 FL=1